MAPRGGANAPNMSDVARRAGTSPAAVSRTMNNRPGVRAEVRAAVLQAADELGYRPHVAARNLAMRRTGLVALVLTDPSVLVDSTLFADIVAPVVTALDDDFRVVLNLPIDDEHRNALGRQIRPGRYDGAIVVGHRHDDPLVGELLHNGVPTVLLGRPLGRTQTSFVDVDNIELGRLAGAHLAAMGSQRVALLSVPPDESWAVDRVDGFRSGLAEFGAELSPDAIATCALMNSDHSLKVTELLRAAPDIDGLFVVSETLLGGALSALAKSGRQVPGDVALICADDGPSRLYHDPPITVVTQPTAELGTALGEVLIETIERPAQRMSRVFSPRLVVRESTPTRTGSRAAGSPCDD